MKRILALDQGEHIGGAELFFSDLLTRISGDFVVHLITGPNQNYQARYKKSKVILHEVELPALKPIGFKTYKNYRKAQKSIEKIIDEVRPEQLISNTVRTHLLVSPLAKKKNIPLTWMAHDRTFPKLFLKVYQKYPQKIISCSKFIEKYYKNTIKSKDIRYHVLYPFGMEGGEIEHLKTIKKQKIIGSVGKFIPWKGQDVFIEMAHKIHQAYPEYRFELIASKYENSHESELFYEKCQNLIQHYKLQNILIIKEGVTEVLPEVARWEILVHCSTAPEPLGRVVLEGMAAGCAVVASELGGAKEVVKNNATGLVAAPTPDAIFQAMKRYLEDQKFMKKVAMAAQEEAERYCWEKVIAEFKGYLDQLL